MAKAKAEDPGELRSKRKAVATLLPYAVRQERDGRPEILDTFLHAARASVMLPLMWNHAVLFAHRLFSEASPRAIVLASPYILWSIDRGDTAQRWEAAASVVPYTEVAAQSVADALFQITANPGLLPVTIKAWSWLTKRPSLPPTSRGLRFGTDLNVVKAVRGLKDTEVLKSYLLLIWSEWNPLWYSDAWQPLWNNRSTDEMCASIREDLGGTGMGHHRADLIKRLDHILGQLDRGLEYLKQHNPRLQEYHFKGMRDQYGKLKDTLLETNVEAIARTSYPMVLLLYILIQADIHRISRNIYMRASSPTSIASRLKPSARPHFICARTSVYFDLTFIHCNFHHVGGSHRSSRPGIVFVLFRYCYCLGPSIPRPARS